MTTDRELDLLVDQLLADPQYQGHPLREALYLKRQQSLDLLTRLERVAKISDGFQSMAQLQNSTLSERYHKQLRQLEKAARISDRYQSMMRDLNVALREASTLDPLTGIANRRLLMERLRQESERAQRNRDTYVLVMLDVDHFKHVNDTWGHEVGDQVLVEVGHTMQGALRQYDLCGRWGGEEFLILLAQTRLADAGAIIERVRKDIRGLVVPNGPASLCITASFGIAEHRPSESFSQTLSRADAALLDAKRNGRDRCEFAKD